MLIVLLLLVLLIPPRNQESYTATTVIGYYRILHSRLYQHFEVDISANFSTQVQFRYQSESRYLHHLDNPTVNNIIITDYKASLLSSPHTLDNLELVVRQKKYRNDLQNP